MRAALFVPGNSNEPNKIGHLAESAIFSQWQHSKASRQRRYARWEDGDEVDIVYLGPEQQPLWIGEIKWPDRIKDHSSLETSVMEFLCREA